MIGSDDWLHDVLSRILDNSLNLLNSSFGTALLGALLGAYSANYFSWRTQEKRLIVERLRAANSARSVSFALLQFSLNMKSQQIKPLIDQFLDDRERFINLHAEQTAKKSDFHVSFDFKYIDLFKVDIKKVVTIVIEETECSSKAVHAALVLEQSFTSIERLISLRKEIIGKMLHEDNTLSTDQQIRLYFGIENVGLGHDTLYYDAMIGIQHNLDSIIFFSDMLFRELDLISRKLSVSIGKGAGKPTTFSFQKDIPAGVFPDKDDFPDWT